MNLKKSLLKLASAKFKEAFFMYNENLTRSKKFYDALTRCNLSQRDLARRLHVSDATISRLIHGDESVKGTVNFWKKVENAKYIIRM